MTTQNFTEDELDNAIVLYREALLAAKEENEADEDREVVVAAAREILYADDIDAHALIVELSDGDSGDRVWSLEEDIIDAE